MKLQDPTLRTRLRSRRTNLSSRSHVPSTAWDVKNWMVLRDRADRITCYLIETNMTRQIMDL